MEKVKRKYKQWTQEEVEELKNLVNEGKYVQEIGDILDRSVNNVRYGMRKIGTKSKAVSKNKNKPSINRKPHVYNTGQEVNGLIIKSKTRYGKNNHRAYEVQGTAYFVDTQNTTETPQVQLSFSPFMIETHKVNWK